MTPDPIHIFTAKDTAQFLQQHPDKKNSLEHFLLETDPATVATNLKTEPIIISKNNLCLFATVNHTEYQNTHLCSPYNVYIGYAKTSAKKFDSIWMRAFVYGSVTVLGVLFKLLKLNTVIQLNNTLSTINLYPYDISDSCTDIIACLTKQFPKHAIIWPRINSFTDKKLCEELKSYRFAFIPTKMTHLFNSNKNYMKIKSTKRDLSVLKQSEYTVVNHDALSAADIVRIQALYEMLFIKKHSTFNPIFTLSYFQQCHRFRWFEFTALRNKNGIIDAFCSQARINNMMICGPSGYDTSKSSDIGLYRMIIWVNLNNAWQSGCLYNMGSGNEQYKLNRGSIRQMEYNTVYYRHLPWYRRAPWIILEWVGNKISIRLFKKYLL